MVHLMKWAFNWLLKFVWPDCCWLLSWWFSFVISLCNWNLKLWKQLRFIFMHFYVALQLHYVRSGLHLCCACRRRHISQRRKDLSLWMTCRRRRECVVICLQWRKKIVRYLLTVEIIVSVVRYTVQLGMVLIILSVILVTFIRDLFACSFCRCLWANMPVTDWVVLFMLLFVYIFSLIKVNVNVDLYSALSWTRLRGAQVWHMFSRDLAVLPAHLAFIR